MRYLKFLFFVAVFLSTQNVFAEPTTTYPLKTTCEWNKTAYYTDYDRPTPAQITEFADQSRCDGTQPKSGYCDSPNENGSNLICTDQNGGDQYMYYCVHGNSCPVPAQKWEVQPRPPFCSQHNSAKCGVDGVPLDEYCSSGEIGKTISCMDDVNDTGSCFRFTCKESAAPITGTINVTANIGSASWTITGPVSVTGSGLSQSLTSQPAGTYTITFDAVSGYISPASQSFTITNQGDVINFSGIYTALPSCTIFAEQDPDRGDPMGAYYEQTDVPVGTELLVNKGDYRPYYCSTVGSVFCTELFHTRVSVKYRCSVAQPIPTVEVHFQ